jgi:hypothetical protein
MMHNKLKNLIEKLAFIIDNKEAASFIVDKAR